MEKLHAALFCAFSEAHGSTILHPPIQQSYSLSPASASGTRARSFVFCNKQQSWGSHSHHLWLHTYYLFRNIEVISRLASPWASVSNKDSDRLKAVSEAHFVEVEIVSQKESIVLFSEFSENLPVISSHPVMASSFVCSLSLKAVSGTTCQGVAAPLFRGLLITWCHGTSVWTVWAEIADAVADGRFGEITTKIKRKQQLFKQSSFGTDLQAPAKNSAWSAHLGDGVWEEHTEASQLSAPAGRLF